MATGTLVLLSLVNDIRTSKISNKITVSFICMGLIINIYQEGISGLYDSLAGCFLPLLLLFPLYSLKMLGAGDIKVFCSIGSIMGIKLGILIIIFSFLSGGILAFIIMIIRKNFKTRMKYIFNFIKSCILTRSIQSYPDFSEGHGDFRFRFSYAIVCGTILCLILMKS